MNQFDKVKFNNCVELFRTILKMNSQDVPQVKKAYLQHAINFEETLDFETQLDLLVLEGDSIKMSERVHRIVSTELNEVKQGQVIANLLIDHLFSDQTQLSKDVGLFIREFRLYDGKFRFRPTLSQNLQLSSLRNLLMELDIIEYDSSAKEYVLADHRVQLKLVNRPSRAFSKKEYVETLKMREQ
ncbi:MAG: hypothetical protein HYY49_06955, partial [Ignavibacteriales bacterium]|nr:hypothetical protein [Ignavibacteriales bacterium]